MSAVAALSEPERRAAFLLRLRAAGVRDLHVLRAMEAVPRLAFFPDIDPGLVLRDLVLPLPDGQTAERPSTLALGLEALGVKAHARVLEVGTGSGYVTALLVRIGCTVTTVERRQALADAARERLTGVGLKPAALRWGDGLAEAPPPGSLDRVLLHVAVDVPPPAFVDALAPGGRLLYTAAGPPRRLVVLRRDADGVVATEVGASTALPGGCGTAPCAGNTFR